MGYRSGAAEGASPGGGHMAGVLLVRVASGQWSRVLIGAEHGAMLIHATLHSGHTTGHWQQQPVHPRMKHQPCTCTWSNYYTGHPKGIKQSENCIVNLHIERSFCGHSVISSEHLLQSPAPLPHPTVQWHEWWWHGVMGLSWPLYSPSPRCKPAAGEGELIAYFLNVIYQWMLKGYVVVHKEKHNYITHVVTWTSGLWIAMLKYWFRQPEIDL